MNPNITPHRDVAASLRLRSFLLGLLLPTIAALLLTAPLTLRAQALEQPKKATSPNGAFRIVNVPGKQDGKTYLQSHFEIHSADGRILANAQDLEEMDAAHSQRAWRVLWSPDSQFVAISAQVERHAVATFVFRHTGRRFDPVKIQTIHGWDNGYGPYYQPVAWQKNRRLVLSVVSYDWYEASDDEFKRRGVDYKVTVQFDSKSSTMREISRTKAVKKTL